MRSHPKANTYEAEVHKNLLPNSRRQIHKLVPIQLEDTEVAQLANFVRKAVKEILGQVEIGEGSQPSDCGWQRSESVLRNIHLLQRVQIANFLGARPQKLVDNAL